MYVCMYTTMIVIQELEQHLENEIIAAIKERLDHCEKEVY